MPLCFFRQVKSEEPDMAPCGRITNGGAIGFVDYKWAGCGWRYAFGVNSESHDHVHLVWIKAGELLRCCIKREEAKFLPQLFLTV